MAVELVGGWKVLFQLILVLLPIAIAMHTAMMVWIVKEIISLREFKVKVCERVPALKRSISGLEGRKRK